MGVVRCANVGAFSWPPRRSDPWVAVLPTYRLQLMEVSDLAQASTCVNFAFLSFRDIPGDALVDKMFDILVQLSRLGG